MTAMTDTCPKCGRPSWRRHGGMGGGLMPDAETHCLRQGNMFCRSAAVGYAAGRRDGIDEGVRIAKEQAGVAWCSAGICWSYVDDEAEKAKGETR